MKEERMHHTTPGPPRHFVHRQEANAFSLFRQRQDSIDGVPKAHRIRAIFRPPLIRRIPTKNKFWPITLFSTQSNKKKGLLISLAYDYGKRFRGSAVKQSVSIKKVTPTYFLHIISTTKSICERHTRCAQILGLVDGGNLPLETKAERKSCAIFNKNPSKT